MSQRYRKPFIFLLMFSLLVTGGLAAEDPVVNLVPAANTLVIGETTTVAVVMDGVPTGLSGFNITVALSKPSVGEIIGVAYPDWAKLPENSSIPSDSVYAQAVDLKSLVGAGEVEMTLCTLTIRGDAVGETGLAVTASKIDDDVGGRYNPTAVSASIAVSSAPAPTTVLSFNPTAAVVMAGDATEYAVVMDAAPTGLSGFNITFSLTDPSVGEIISVAYPDWAELSENSSLPADSVYAKVVDLTSSIGSGTTNMTLCTLTVRGKIAGETNLTISAMKIDDDVGGRYAPETTDGILVVEDLPIMKANFTANVTAGVTLLTVQFTDTSTTTPTDWLWSFGDEVTSNSQNPTHTYTKPGNYTVTLSINGGEYTCTKPKYIRVTPFLFGDATGDGVVNQVDTLRVLKEVVGMSPKPVGGTEAFERTDVHRNGIIEVGDAMFIAQYNVGLRDPWFALIG